MAKKLMMVLPSLFHKMYAFYYKNSDDVNFFYVVNSYLIFLGALIYNARPLCG